ncbi:MAG: hypothetical protein J6Q85_00665 [Clostridia bacterium]|nr:hypothetical protein [Clostridia bacterium]
MKKIISAILVGVLLLLSSCSPTPQNGKDGKDGITPTFRLDGDTLMVSYDGGSSWATLGNIKGEDGESGTNGTNGITPTFKLEDGALMVSYDSGATWTALGNIKGEDGASGTNGTTPKLMLQNGMLMVSYNNGTSWSVLGNVKGEDGKNGTDGITPELKLEDGKLMVSYDNGETWNELGSVSGEVTPPVIEDTFEPTAEISNGYGGKNGIICLMTDNDNGLFDTVRLLDELYIKYNLVGGIGTVVKQLYTDATYTTPKTSTVAKWQEFLDTGRWSIICHSMTHTTYCDKVDGVTTVNEEKIYNEIVRSAELLRELFPNERVITYAQTGVQSAIGAPSDPNDIRQAERDLIAEYYIGGRFKGAGATAFDELEWNNLPYDLIRDTNLTNMLRKIDDAAINGKYFMVYNHYVIEDEKFNSNMADQFVPLSVYEGMCARIKEHVDNDLLWCASFEDAVMYMRERQTANLVVDYENGAITVLLTDEMDDDIYNHKLTVKISVPDSWEAVKVTQGSDVSYAEVVVAEGGERYVLADVLPDGGMATLTSVSRNEIPEKTPETVKPTPSTGTTPSTPSTTAPDVYTFEGTIDEILETLKVANKSDLALEKEKDNQILVFNKSTGSTNNSVSFNGNSTEGAGRAEIEMDLKIVRTSSSGEIYFSVGEYNLAHYAYRAYMRFNANGTITYVNYNEDKSIQKTANLGVNLGETFKLKLVYENADNGSVTITVYVNGNKVLTSNNHYNTNKTPISAGKIQTVCVNFSSSCLGSLYFDNVSVKQIAD